MKKILFVALILFFAACSTTTYTNRSQLMLIDEKEEAQLGLQSAKSILKESKVITNTAKSQQVKRVGEKIAKVANKPDFQWEFYLIDDEIINAFCLPGGKVFVYTGLMELVQNDDELAVVIGHEVAHAILRHGAERMSMQSIQGTLGGILGIVLDIATPSYSQAFQTAYGLGSNVGIMLPYSRSHELEADEVGILLMKEAGYNPQYALTFWKKMAEKSQGGNLDFLSTHPNDKERIQKIQTILNKG